MTERNETLADVFRKMRGHYMETNLHDGDLIDVTEAHHVLLDYADRAEAALKLERGIMHDYDKWNAFVQGQDAASYWRERCHDAEERERKAGNAAKLREALEAAHFFLVNLDADLVEVPEQIDELCEVQKRIEDALAEPPRNCDVGTAEEQAKRFKLFCDANQTCAGCPCGLHPSPSCGVAWAQMPYEATAAQEGGDHADA